MKAWEIEHRIFELEQVRIVIRAPWSKEFQDYNYDRKAASNTSITEWLEQRVRPLLGEADVVVINGNGEFPHGRTKMDKLRQSYER